MQSSSRYYPHQTIRPHEFKPVKSYSMTGRKSRKCGSFLIFLSCLLVLIGLPFCKSRVILLILCSIIGLFMLLIGLSECCLASKATYRLDPTSGILSIKIQPTFCLSTTKVMEQDYTIRDISRVMSTGPKETTITATGFYDQHGRYYNLHRRYHVKPYSIAIYTVHGDKINYSGTFTERNIAEFVTFIAAYNYRGQEFSNTSFIPAETESYPVVSTLPDTTPTTIYAPPQTLPYLSSMPQPLVYPAPAEAWVGYWTQPRGRAEEIPYSLSTQNGGECDINLVPVNVLQ
ncbi:hypothetical protein BLNAU_10675 [Blattamonas nauphoetae]|uniref:Uncharacterized protein n=1 Tax=Blattamonas nauphoetae TaxID=2049346 RepID=A0ABQ9XPK1_9EUKA|nr:hypothetical protein BLNAU_10675 [Blattamonas nauphoetae]